MVEGRRGKDEGVIEVTDWGNLLLGDVGGELLLGVTLSISFFSTEGLELNKESIQKELFSL